MRDKRKYEELFPEEFMGILGKTPICYWACGPMEYHGLQNTLGIDPVKAYEICLRAAAISGGIVFPLVPFAPAGRLPSLKRAALRRMNPKAAPSLMTCVETCERLYIELFESLADMGFKACVAFGGHGPAGNLLKKIEKDRDGRMDDMLFAACTSTSFLHHVTREDSAVKFCHGGMWETSMNMAVNPELTDLSRTRGPADGTWPGRLEKYPDDRLADIMKSNRAFGEQILNVSARAVAEIAAALFQKKEWVYPGYVVNYRVSPVLPCTEPLGSLRYPAAADIGAFSARVFREPFCVIPEFADRYQGRPLLAYYMFNLDCPKSARLDLGLGYDGPVAVWVDRDVRFNDAHGTCPGYGPDGGAKKVIPLELSRGRHDVLIALVSNQGQAAGISVQVERGDNDVGI